MTTVKSRSFNAIWSFNEYNPENSPAAGGERPQELFHPGETEHGARGEISQPLAPQGFPGTNKKVQQADTLYQPAVLVLETYCGNDRMALGGSKSTLRGVHFNDCIM